MRHINVAHPFLVYIRNNFLTLRSNPSLSDERSSDNGA